MQLVVQTLLSQEIRLQEKLSTKFRIYGRSSTTYFSKIRHSVTYCKHKRFCITEMHQGQYDILLRYLILQMLLKVSRRKSSKVKGGLTYRRIGRTTSIKQVATWTIINYLGILATKFPVTLTATVQIGVPKQEGWGRTFTCHRDQVNRYV